MVDVNTTLCQSVRDERSVWRPQSEESANRFQRDRTVSAHHRRIEIKRVELGRKKSDLALAAGAQARAMRLGMYESLRTLLAKSAIPCRSIASRSVIRR